MTLSCSAVLKLLKMAVGMRALLDTVMQALPQVAGRGEWARGVLSRMRACSPKGWGKLAQRSSGTFSIAFPLFQVGNLGLLFMLLFFIFAALGVELFGDLGELGQGGQRSQGWKLRDSRANSRPSPLPPCSECDETHPCEGLGRHATFRNFGMAFLTLFRVSTGDNWNGIMKVRAPHSEAPPRAGSGLKEMAPLPGSG